jgi:PST family polysaccharide transporter
MPKHSQQLLAGAGLLAISGLLAKILSAVYRVPFQNMVGNTGFYVYQQVYPLYGIGMVLALSGWPLFISKIITEQPDEARQELVARRLFWALLGIGAGLFALFFGFAPSWALLMGGDMRLAPAIRAVAWMFWLMPFLAVGRGFAQGRQNMMPTAISQVVEQVVRVAVILTVAAWAVHHDWSVYWMGAWTTFAATVAGLAATLFLSGSLRQIWARPIPTTVRQAADIRWTVLVGRLLREGGILAMLSALLVLLQLVDSFGVKVLLQDAGMTAGLAEATKGVYDRGQPLVQLGMVVATGLGTSLLPTLRAQFMRKDRAGFVADFQLTIRLSMLLSVIAAVGLAVTMPVVNQFLFGSRQGSQALAWYAVIIVPATLIVVATSVLQSVDRVRGLGLMIVGTMVLKSFLNEWLVPQFGITGASLATLLALLPMLFFSLARLPKFVWKRAFSSTWFVKLVITAVAVGGVAWLLVQFGNAIFGLTRPASILTTIVAVVGGVAVFLGAIAATNLLTKAEWQALPKGDKLYEKLKRGK